MADGLFASCSGTLVVTLEHYGYEGRPYLQSDVWTLALECSESGCYWNRTGYADRLTTVTQSFLAEQQADHDARATRYNPEAGEQRG